MAIQDTIQELRGRTPEERRSIALSISIGVVAVLLIGWLFFVFSRLDVGQVAQVPGAYNAAVANVQETVGNTGWVSTASPEAQSYVAPEPLPADQTGSDGLELIEEGSASGSAAVPGQ